MSNDHKIEDAPLDAATELSDETLTIVDAGWSWGCSQSATIKKASPKGYGGDTGTGPSNF